MFNSHLFRFRYFVVMLLLFILVASVYAFAAANVVPESGAGDGKDDISGYTVTAVTYDTMKAPDTNPATIDQVSFDLAPTAGAGAATEVYVKLESGGSSWFSCAPALRWIGIVRLRA